MGRKCLHSTLSPSDPNVVAKYKASVLTVLGIAAVWLDAAGGNLLASHVSDPISPCDSVTAN